MRVRSPPSPDVTFPSKWTGVVSCHFRLEIQLFLVSENYNSSPRNTKKIEGEMADHPGPAAQQSPRMRKQQVRASWNLSKVNRTPVFAHTSTNGCLERTPIDPLFP